MGDISLYRPELAGLPEYRDAGLDNIRLQGTLVTRMPAMAQASLEGLSSMNPREMEALQLMADLRAAYGVSRSYDRRNRAVAKARARQKDRSLKNSTAAGKIQRRKQQGFTKRREKAIVRNYARNHLGMGTDLYR